MSNQAFATEIWNDSKGLKYLEESEFKNDFYQLVNFYQPQINPLFCSIATSVTILNALKYPQTLTQENFLNAKTDQIKSQKIIRNQLKNKDKKYDPGLSLKDLSQILNQVYNLKVKTTHIEKNNEQTIEEFRLILREVLAEKQKFLIVNFDGQSLGLETHGHVSPIAAYDQKNDLVLVLDVALYKNQWFWTSTKELISAMNSKDDQTYRGYLVVERKF